MLAWQRLTKHYGGRTLFEDASAQLNAGCRYGLVGANGSGKSTLMRILCGDEPASSGEVVLPKGARLGVLRQDQHALDEERILDVAMRGDADVLAALRSHDPARQDFIAAHDGWSLEARAGAVLEGLGIPDAQHELPLRTLSGGYKLRVLLAQVLLSRPDVLLLDEPTNHLDIISIRWLEKFLAASAGCAIVISHDQRFLENVATHILDIDYGTITMYPGGWRKFLDQKAQRREIKEAEIQNKLDAIEHKRAFVERFGAKNTKARQAQSRLKQIEKIEADLEELPDSSRRAPLFRFDITRPSGKEALTFENVSKSFGDKRVLANVSLAVRRGEKVAVIGPNGVGKSTLLKIAAGRLEADGGGVKWGHETQLGWFAQDHRELLTNGDDTPHSFLERHSPDTATAFVRGHLGRVLFSGDDVKKSVRALSGGEAARLVLASIVVRKPNVLLLDEPTNHLDLEAIQALTEALQRYEGTIVFVSHDRWFVSALATRIVEIRAAAGAGGGGSDANAGMRDFPGTWDEYLASAGDDHLDAASSLKAQRQAQPEGPSAGALAHEEARRKKSARASLEKKREKVMADLERQEARRDAIRALWCSDGFYEKTAPDEQRKLTQEEQALASSIEALMAEWERIEAELAANA